MKARFIQDTAVPRSGHPLGEGVLLDNVSVLLLVSLGSICTPLGLLPEPSLRSGFSPSCLIQSMSFQMMRQLGRVEAIPFVAMLGLLQFSKSIPVSQFG